MHTARIRSIAADAAGHYLVTGSDDKTVRVWDLYRSTLLQTLRLPGDSTARHAIDAVAITRDGRIVAAAAASPASVYLFERDTGRMLRYIAGPPAQVLQLVFTVEGDRLAATSAAGGLRVFRVSDGSEIGRDEAYAGPASGADIDRAGHLVTSSADGFLRLYDPSVKLLLKVPCRQGAHAVRFSPDGTRIAIGYGGEARVELRAAKDLTPLPGPVTSGIEGDLPLVAWSPEGALYAGGALHTGGARVRRWEDGKGRFEDLPLLPQGLDGLLPLPGKEMAVVTGGPSFEVWSPASKQFRGMPGLLVDFRGSELLVNDTGTQVRFSYGQKGPAALLSIEDHSVLPNPPADARLRPPLLAAPGLDLGPWKDAARVALNGAELPLGAGEVCRSLAISRDGQWLLLGTDTHLYAFDRQGQQRWRADLPAAALAVNLSGNGQVALAALADGTLRFHAGTDGHEVLAFLPHSDQKRWVAFTPSGYYDASSVDGAALFGWQLDRGPDQTADFFPASLLRAHRYRPAVIARVLSTLDEGRVLADANAEEGRPAEPPLRQLLPPVVAVLSPREGVVVTERQLTLQVAVRSPSGEPAQLRALVQGRVTRTRAVAAAALPQEGQSGPAEDHVQMLMVTVPEEDTTLAVLAETRHGISAPVLLHLRWGGAPSSAPVVKPRLYVLAVGVGKYRQEDLTLDYPAKDARDLTAALKGQQGKAYREVEARVLTDEQATRENIVAGLAWLRQRAESEDVVALFLAGHGMNETGTGKYYYLPYEADLGAMARTMVAGDVVQEALSRIAGKVVLFLDTCHAGSVLDPGRRRSISDMSRFVGELSATESGVVVYAAAAAQQLSKESKRWGNGAFTLAAVEGLRGKADTRNTGRITVSTMQTYISDRVRELTKEEQTPTLGIPGTVPDFLLATVRVRYPVQKKWWFWGAVGAVVAGTTAGIIVGASRLSVLPDGVPVFDSNIKPSGR